LTAASNSMNEDVSMASLTMHSIGDKSMNASGQAEDANVDKSLENVFTETDSKAGIVTDDDAEPRQTSLLEGHTEATTLLQDVDTSMQVDTGNDANNKYDVSMNELVNDTMQVDSTPSGAASTSAPNTTGSTLGLGTTPTMPTLPINDNPWDNINDIMSILKSTNPLLALTIETMIDQILQRLKPTSEEDMYRLLVALLNDGVQQLASRLSHHDEDRTLSSASMMNIQRIADMLPSGDLKTAFVKDFIQDAPTLPEYLRRLRHWKDAFGIILAERPTNQPLESYSHYLTEFEHQRFDDVEVPGQYDLIKDSNDDFARIERFDPSVITSLHQSSYIRHITMHGHNGSLHTFAVQHPSPRSCRREERLVQLFRMMNCMLERRLEARRRALAFHLPVTVPLAPQVRLVKYDTSYVTLDDIVADQLQHEGTRSDEPIFRYIQLFSELASQSNCDIAAVKSEICELISNTIVPNHLLSAYFSRIMASPIDLWMLRKRFTSQFATSTFLTYIFGVNNRGPQKYYVSRNTGNIWSTEILPCKYACIQRYIYIYEYVTYF
jgi:transformation/transcription domain-associated protein